MAAQTNVELKEVPVSIVGGFDVHRNQITFDCLDTETGEAFRGEIRPATRVRLRAWLGRFEGRVLAAVASFFSSLLSPTPCAPLPAV